MHTDVLYSFFALCFRIVNFAFQIFVIVFMFFRLSPLTLRLLMSYIYMEHLFLMFLYHTQRRTTVGRTPLDEWSARRRDLYLTTHNTHNRQTSMPTVGFEPTISAGEWPQNYALDGAAPGTGIHIYIYIYVHINNLRHGKWIILRVCDVFSWFCN